MLLNDANLPDFFKQCQILLENTVNQPAYLGRCVDLFTIVVCSDEFITDRECFLIIIIIINLVSIIIKMNIEWRPFCQKYGYFIVDHCLFGQEFIFVNVMLFSGELIL